MAIYGDVSPIPARTAFIRNALIATLLLFVLLSAMTATGVPDGLDQQITAMLAMRVETSPRWLILFMQAVSWIGGGLPRWGIVILLCVLVWRWRGERWAVAFGGASLLSNLASTLLKIAFGRQRPDLSPHLDHVASASYPSGHATSAAVVYLLLALLVPPRWRFAAWVLAAMMIVLTGFSRILLGVHWASDVIGGTLLGASFALFAAWWAFTREDRTRLR